MLAAAVELSSYRVDAVMCGIDLDTAADAGIATGRNVDLDPVPLDLSDDEWVSNLANKVCAYDLVVCCDTVAVVAQAMESLDWRPAVVELSSLIPRPGNDDRPEQYDRPGSLSGSAADWVAMLDDALARRKPAATANLFASFIQGGFECSTHRHRDGRRLDLLDSTGHSRHAALDYAQLAGHGILSVRDGLRWHLIEQHPGHRDWSSFLPMLRAANTAKTQVVWDLLHYGWPDGLDIWSPAFVDRFAAFAAAAATIVRDETDAVPFYCPVNEISFHSWGGGDVAYINPHAHGRGFELKAQLARASIAAMQAILAVDPRARFLHCEPAINIAALPSLPDRRIEAENARLAQFQAFDMIAGRLWPQLGGEERLLDIVGLNYYHDNQWQPDMQGIEPGHLLWKPFRYFLTEAYARYGRPLLVAETGREGDARAAWFMMIAREVDAARAAGVPVEGICLYPIIDHFGWDDDRECPSGLLSSRMGEGRRQVHAPLADAIEAYRNGFGTRAAATRLSASRPGTRIA